MSQRKRWASKSTRYKEKSVVVLGVSIWLFNLFLFGHVLNAIFNPVFWPAVLACIAAKMVLEFILLLPLSSFARRNSYLKYLPFLSALHVVYLIFIGIAGNSGRYEWKGRLVR